MLRSGNKLFNTEVAKDQIILGRNYSPTRIGICHSILVFPADTNVVYTMLTNVNIILVNL